MPSLCKIILRLGGSEGWRSLLSRPALRRRVSAATPPSSLPHLLDEGGRGCGRDILARLHSAERAKRSLASEVVVGMILRV